MDIVKAWKHRLKQVEKEIEDYNDILKNNCLGKDMKSFCLSKIHSMSKYKDLIEETLKELMKNKTRH